MFYLLRITAGLQRHIENSLHMFRSNYCQPKRHFVSGFIKARKYVSCHVGSHEGRYIPEKQNPLFSSNSIYRFFLLIKTWRIAQSTDISLLRHLDCNKYFYSKHLPFLFLCLCINIRTSEKTFWCIVEHKTLVLNDDFYHCSGINLGIQIDRDHWLFFDWLPLTF